ncbi:MAG: winged helix-turn-helix transcriptional regulator [Cyclobacteriaceae bacterium]
MILKNGLTAVWLARSLLGLSICLLLTAAFSFTSKRPLDDEMLRKQRTLALRSIGHSLLLDHGDSTSVIPPIADVNSNTLRLIFNHPISINPDKLSAYSIDHIDASMANHFIVTVKDMESKNVVYGFEMDYQDPVNIPCVGRVLPVSNYSIEVSFYDQKGVVSYNVQLVALGAISFLGFVGLMLFRRKLKSEVKISFSFQDNTITIGSQKIQLTEKEIQILFILHKNNGQLVTRNYLVAEVWSKEGVITDRSLDVYISRLRKKLDEISNIQILNRHGKGYILRSE